MSELSKDGAIEAIKKGHKVRHSLFCPDEWMKLTGCLFEFEDGCLCEQDEFWRARNESFWLTVWSLVE